MDPAGGTAYTPVAALNQWKLDLKRDRADATCFGDTNKVYVIGLPDMSGDLAGIWDETESPALFTVALGEDPVMLKLVPSTVAPTHFFSGLAYLDTSIEVKADGVITIKGTFAAAGPWTMDPAGP
jgi:hypothetical protein